MSAPAPSCLSVWIVNYHSAHLLGRCLAGLSSTAISRIVILDNASGPDDQKLLHAFAAADSRIFLLISDTNVGFAAGHSRIAAATAAAPGELVWILNPDTEVTPAATERLCAVLNTGAADIVSPVLLTGPADRPAIWFAGGELDLRRGRVTHRRAGEPPEVTVPGGPLVDSPFLSGAAPMMARATWDLLHGFRTDLFLYWEDVDLSVRATARQLRLAVVPDAVIWHAEGGSTPSSTGVSATAYYYSARNRVIVSAAGWRRWGLVLGRGTPFLIRLAATALLKAPGRRLGKLRAVLSGTWAGLQGRTGPRAIRRRSPEMSLRNKK